MVSVMLIGGILVTMAVSLVGLATQQVRNRARYETYKDEFAAAEWVLNKTLGQMKFMNEAGVEDLTGKIEEIENTPPVLEGYEFPNFTVTKISEGSEVVPEGEDYAGMVIYALRYQVDVTARKVGGTAGRFEHGGVSLRQNILVSYRPLFSFAIFYDPIMEIAPGAFMQITGRVHTNGDAYIQSSAGLDFLKQVTVAGDLHYGRYSASGQSGANGDVRYTNGGGLLSMKVGGSWLDCNSPDWATTPLDRWNKNVKDSTHGINRLGLPIPSSVDPHAIIERAASDDCYAVQQEKFENKAGLKIFRASNGTLQLEDFDGNSVSPTYAWGGGTKTFLTQTTFYDAREKKTIASIDLDIANLIESGKGPDNGIVYVSSENVSGNLAALRLINGQKLPTKGGGFTVATENPLYIKGKYNTTDKTMAMVVGDSLTLLSSSWSDTNSNKAISYRTASNSEVNAVCMQGIVPSSGGKVYSGGVENFFRLLEDWNGKELKFQGSLINLWLSTKATGSWSGTGTVYNPPKRTWAWDSDLGGTNGPPGANYGVDVTCDEWTMPSGAIEED